MTANTGVHTCSYYCERPGRPAAEQEGKSNGQD